MTTHASRQTDEARIAERFRQVFGNQDFMVDGRSVLALTDGGAGTVAEFNDAATAQLIAELLNFARARTARCCHG
jgi:hypothetical protein